MELRECGYRLLASMSSDPFDYITGKKELASVDANGITSDASLLGIGASFVNLMTVVGALGIVCSLIFLGYKLILYKGDPRLMSDVKQSLIRKFGIAIGIFSFMTLAGIIFGVIQQSTAVGS